MAIEEDLLGRIPLVEMIANAILTKARNNHECYTIGIYGKWGEGKTSVLNMLKNYLLSHKNDNILISNFNPWILKNQEAMLMEFFNVLVKESIFTKSAEKIKEYATAISLGIGAISNVIIPASGIAAAKATKSFIDALPSFKQTIQERKSNISNIITKSGKHLLVLIDDVDRLDNTETHALLKLVRQVADFENIIYVIAMDADIVSKSVSQYFGAGTYDDGRRFLDKIVQIPIVLPQIENEKLRHILLCKLSDLFTATSSSISASISKEVVEKIGDLFNSLREIFRYINQLSFVLPSLYKEVNIVDLCMLEAVKLFNIQGYNLIYENRNVVLRKHFALESALTPSEELAKTDAKNLEVLIRNVANGLPDKVRLPLEYMLKYELLYEDLLPNSMKLIETKRLCCDIYFDKYFMQSVPSNIISDAFLDEHSTDITDKGIDRIAQIFDELYKKYSLEEVKRAAIYWINPSEKDLKIQSRRAAKVCKALAAMSINGECAYHLINPYNLDIFISMQLMSMYMLSQSDDMFHSREYDEDCIFETCRYIVQNSDIRFSMIFLYQIRRSHAWTQKDNLTSMFSILRNRLFEEFDELEIFKYSKGIQEVFFEIWKAKDKTEFLAFIKKSIRNPDFPIVKFISVHIDNTQDDSSYWTFLKLFECKEQIANRLKSAMTTEDMKNPSITLFCKNCGIDSIE
ncbi:MAG: KAP family NTPase [Bacteroides cellulosilyticus]|nr:KAP family NTPase [Bacteroides cellulosilyticus]